MKKILLIALLLFVPITSASIELGLPYFNPADYSIIKFEPYNEAYVLCAGDKTVIPLLIKNENNHSDTYSFSSDSSLVTFPVQSAEISKGKSAVLPISIQPRNEALNHTIKISVASKKEKIKRSVILSADILDCYNLTISPDVKQSCGDEERFELSIENNGPYDRAVNVGLDAPLWVNMSGKEKMLLEAGDKIGYILAANPPESASGEFDITAYLTQNLVVLATDKSTIKVNPRAECFNTEIIAPGPIQMTHEGKNVPITIKNNAVNDASYTLLVSGVPWYLVSQESFSIRSKGSKVINLGLYPGEDVSFGSYKIELKAVFEGQEISKTIDVQLRESRSLLAVNGLASYYRYDIFAGIMVILAITAAFLLSMRFLPWQILKKILIYPAVIAGAAVLIYLGFLSRQPLARFFSSIPLLHKPIISWNVLKYILLLAAGIIIFFIALQLASRSAKTAKKKLRLANYIYAGAALLIFFSAATFIIFYGTSDHFITARDFVMGNYLYLISSFVVLISVVLGFKFHGSFKAWHKYTFFAVIILAIIGMAGYFIVRYADAVKEFITLYYFYILMGLGILAISILILSLTLKKES